MEVCECLWVFIGVVRIYGGLWEYMGVYGSLDKYE